MVPSLFPIHRATLSLVFLAGSVVAGMAQESPSDPAQIVHVLNRITFGPRPGDVEMVQKMGLRNYIQQQLHPETVDDSAVEQEVAQFALLQMTPQQLTDIYDVEIAKKREKVAERRLANNPPAMPSTTGTVSAAVQPSVDKETMTAQPQVDPTTQNPIPDPASMAKLGEPEKMAQMVQALPWRSLAGIGQLEQAKLVRAIDSQRQLQEVLADFWNNHFNIDVKKKFCALYKITDDRDAIRPHIWGKFRDLLEASAKSPAMLIYLDNATSSVSHTVTPMEQQKVEQVATQMTQNGLAAAAPEVPVVGQRRGGINENYARELMELHTLGVDGGYTQQDVQEVARCFTGWSVDKKTGEFMFRPRQHDNGAKVVLGHNIPSGGGMQDGERVLDILASSPACAKFISKELCQRFVADDPSPALSSTASRASSPEPAATSAPSRMPSSPVRNSSLLPATATRSNLRSNSPSPPSVPPERPSFRRNLPRSTRSKPRRRASPSSEKPRLPIKWPSVPGNPSTSISMNSASRSSPARPRPVTRKSRAPGSAPAR